MVLHWRLSDNKSPKVSRTLLSILADLSNALVWIISTRPLISKFSILCTNPLVTVPRAPITFGITVTFMFHNFFSSLARSRYYPSFRFLSTLLCGQPEQQSSFFFLLIIIRSGRLAEIRWSVCISKSQGSLCISFSRTNFGLSIYHLLVWSNLDFLHSGSPCAPSHV